MKPIERNLWRGMDEQGNWHYGDLKQAFINEGLAKIEYITVEPLIRFKSKFINRVLHTVPVLPHTVGQWTGLEDMANKKIFGGHVVEWLGREVRNNKQVQAKRTMIVDCTDIECLARLKNICDQRLNVKITGTSNRQTTLRCTGITDNQTPRDIPC